MRKVKVFKIHWSTGTQSMEKELVGIGEFHQFGADYEEFETGPGNYTTAIVEMPDGTIHNVPAEQIQFITGE